MMVLKRSFLSDTGEGLALYVHCSDLLGNKALSQYSGFIGKVDLKRLFLSDTGEASSLHIHCSGLPGERASSHSSGRESFQLIQQF